MEDFLNSRKNESGIIYCLSRKSTEDLAAKLKAKGFQTSFYHAGMSSEERSGAQEAFINDEVPIICATVAFGMGIDKSNVRWVIHNNLPRNLEGYYQEIGRAGRDGLPSDTLLYYNLKDIILLTKFAKESGQPELSMEKLRRIQQYAEARVCRRKILLSYFGETCLTDCGNCDVCKNPPLTTDGTILAQKALSALSRLGEKVGTTMLIHVLRGSQNGELLELGYQHIKTYGAGKDLSYDSWTHYMLQFLQLGLIEIAYDENFTLRITEYGKLVLKGHEKIQLVNIPVPEEKKQKKKKVISEAGTVSASLFEDLRKLRKLIAESASLPPYVIFHDKSLREMCALLPRNRTQMLKIPGVSESKFEKYGTEFLSVIIDFAGAVTEEEAAAEPMEVQKPAKRIKNPVEADSFFTQPLFNNMDQKTRELLSAKAGALPILRMSEEITNDYIHEQRKVYPRAYEPWEQEEVLLFEQAVKLTNDLDLLSAIFQRNAGSLKTFYKRMSKSLQPLSDE